MASLVFALVFSTNRAVAEVGIDQSIGAVRGWDIGLSDTTGGCLATTSFTDGTNLFVGFTGDGASKGFYSNPQALIASRICSAETHSFRYI